MTFWRDTPVAQWIYTAHEAHSLYPWCVFVGGYKRAQFSTEAEAEKLRQALNTAFLKNTPKPKKTK